MLKKQKIQNLNKDKNITKHFTKNANQNEPKIRFKAFFSFLIKINFLSIPL